MSIPRSVFDQVAKLMRPLQTKVANIVARAVLTGLNDSTTLQAAQVTVLAGETLDDVERFGVYGVISVPRAGAEGVVLFVDGDRGHPLLVAVDDRSARPTGGDPGDTGLYHFDGATVRLNSSGDILITAKAGQKIIADDGSGAGKLATLADLDALRDWVFAQFSATAGHIHTVVGAATTSMVTVPAVPPPPPPAPALPPSATGTLVLEGK